jgi:hypothetical protein
MEERLNSFGYSVYDPSLCAPPSFADLLPLDDESPLPETAPDPVA